MTKTKPVILDLRKAEKDDILVLARMLNDITNLFRRFGQNVEIKKKNKLIMPR